MILCSISVVLKEVTGRIVRVKFGAGYVISFSGIFGKLEIRMSSRAILLVGIMCVISFFIRLQVGFDPFIVPDLLRNLECIPGWDVGS